jgi:hypothetical protein
MKPRRLANAAAIVLARPRRRRQALWLDAASQRGSARERKKRRD